MPRANLTARSVAALKPQARRVDYFDKKLPGFCLRITPAGVKTFSAMYRHAGRLRRLTIGTYPRLSLAEARGRAKKALGKAEQGTDPAAEKKAERQAETFEELAEAYMERHAKKKKKSWREDQRKLNSHLLPRFGKTKASEVTRADVRSLLESIAETAPVQANRVLALIRKIYNWGISQDLIEANPCWNLERPSKERRRERVLSEDELRSVWRSIEEQGGLIAPYFRIRLLTAQRGGEVASMAWEDLDLKTAWWTIPAERSKNGLSHRVPLSPQAVQILKSLRTAAKATKRESPWVFPHRRRPSEYITEVQKGIQRIREAAGVEFRGHDLRRTSASLMTGMGIPRLTVSKILNHVEQGVTAVYDRHSYDLEKRDALDRWARHLMKIVKGLKEVEAEA